jgi:hypothetical protein
LELASALAVQIDRTDIALINSEDGNLQSDANPDGVRTQGIERHNLLII